MPSSEFKGSDIIGSGEKRLDININQPRWDQSTYLGRVKHFFILTDARNIFATPGQLDRAKKLVQDYRDGAPMDKTTVDELWAAKYLYDSAFHPDTGEKLIVLGRMSSIAPANMILGAGMLTFRTTLGVSYVCATSAAVGTALGVNSFVTKFPPVVGRLVPLGAVLMAAAINLPIMRNQEYKYLYFIVLLPCSKRAEELLLERRKKREEISQEFFATNAMVDRNWTGPNCDLRRDLTKLAVHGFHHKLCTKPGFHEPTEQCVCNLCEKHCSRYHFTIFPSRIRSLKDYSNELPRNNNTICTFVRIPRIPPFFTNILDKKGILRRHPRIELPFQLALVGIANLIANPLCCAFFPQMMTIEVSKLEPHVQ
ncbi:hypothetical protein ANN_15275, partial [Periplaneta americana]